MLIRLIVKIVVDYYLIVFKSLFSLRKSVIFIFEFETDIVQNKFMLTYDSHFLKKLKFSPVLN